MKIPENIKAVIFDLDGLLIDSEPVWGETDTILLQKRGFTPTPELFLKRLGTGTKGTLEIYKQEFGLDEDVDNLTHERLEIYFDLLWKNLQLMEGAEGLIKHLHDNKKRLAIATSGPYDGKLEKILELLNVNQYFPITVLGSEVKHHKPAPDIFIYCGKKLEINSDDCLVLEDAPNGVLAAKAAGMIAWGVSKDGLTQKGLIESGADEVFTSLSEITL